MSKNFKDDKNLPSSLIEFSVENFGCFRDRTTFSMRTQRGARNSFLVEKTDDMLLTTSIIYGANASGKSTLIQAIEFVKNKILLSSSPDRTNKIAFSPFLLQKDCIEKPSYFEIIFSTNGVVYEYNFSISSDHTIVSENLIAVKKTTEEDIFIRKNNLFTNCKGEFDDSSLQKKTKDNALFLSVCNQWNNKEAEKIFTFFQKNINFIDSHNTMGVSSFTQEMIRNSIDNKKSILEIIQKFDFAIEDFIEKEKVIPLSSLPISVQEMFEKNHNISGNETVKEVSFHFTHKSFDSNNDNEGDIEIPMRNQSGGTKKLFEELGPIIDTLQHGKILIFDELNTCFHPKILKAIVDLFHDKEANPHNAQLIFTTHETSLLAYAKDEIDRDAFWFTERDAYGRASLFSLSEFKERKDSANIDKKYLEGRYGAVPFIAYNL